MRWKEKEKEFPKRGQTRTIKRFLFWPKKLTKSETINGVPDCRRGEWRWFETSSILQQYGCSERCRHGTEKYDWLDIQWAD